MAERYASLKHGLVGCWIPSVSGSGFLLPDLSGRGNNGVLTNMASDDWVSSQYGRALDFDGVDDFVPTTAPGVTTVNRSVSVWFRSSVNLSNGQYATLVRMGTATSFPADIGKDFQVLFGTDANFGTNAIGISQYGDAVAATGFNDGRWHHGYFEAKGSVYSIYLDGVFRTSKTMTTNATAGTISIGREYSFSFLGQLDDIRIYNRALSESEIRLLASRPGIGLRQDRDRQTFYQFPSGSRRRLLLTGQT